MILQDQQLHYWTQPGDVGGTGGGTDLPHGTMDWNIVSGDIAHLTFRPAKRQPGQPWDTFYLYRDLGPCTQKAFSYILEVAFPTQADIDACEAFEFELQKADGKYIYNMAYQFRFSNQQLYVFNYTTKKWESAWVIIAPFFDVRKPTRMIADFQQLGQTLIHRTLMVNDTWLDLNISHSATPRVSPGSYLHCAIQWDSKGQGVPGEMDFRDCVVGAW